MQRAFRWKRVALVGGFVTLLAVASAGSYLCWLGTRFSSAGNQWAPDSDGTLIVCGGGHVPDEIRECFVACAGGKRGRIVVIPAYEPTVEDRQRLIDVWRAWGVASVEVVDVADRAAGDSALFAAPVDRATGVWIGGGDQARLAELYAGTAVESALRALLARGGVIGGSSAGAAVLSQVMIAGDGEPVREQRGFDLLHGSVVDQHFFYRNRPQRLLAMLHLHPELVGLGVDEHTAVVVRNRQQRWSVIGESYAMVCLPTTTTTKTATATDTTMVATTAATTFPRLEILKAGDIADMSLMRDDPEAIAINSPGMVDDMVRANSKPN